MEVVLYLCIGALAGLLSGLIGIGGGVVVVPLLASIFEHNGFPHELVMHFAAGTSLAVMIVTTSASLRAHLKFGKNVWPILKSIIPGLIAGVIFGGLLADYLHSHMLRILFGLLLVGMAMKTFFVAKVQASDKEHPPWIFSAAGFGVGSLSGLLGIGGGTVMIPFLLYMAIDIRYAVAISTSCGLVSGVIGTITYILTGLNEVHSMPMTTGHIYWPAFFFIALATPLFAMMGAMISYKLPVRALQRIFALFLLLAAVKLLVY